MGKKTAVESFFNEITKMDIDIRYHAFLKGEVSELYYNEFFIGQESEFDEELGKEFKAFGKEVNEELKSVRNPTFYLKALQRELEDMKIQFEVLRSVNTEKVEIAPVPKEKIEFFDAMANIQSGYIIKAEDFVENNLEQFEPTGEKEGAGKDGFSFKFNLSRKEVMTLLLLMEGAGWIESSISKTATVKFIETYFKYRNFDKDRGVIYNKMTSLQILINQIRKDDIDTDNTIKELMNDLSSAEIEKRPAK